MKTKTTRRILAALITIPIAISLTGCGGQDSKESEPKKPAVTSSQSVKTKKAAKEKAQATPAPQKPAVQQPKKPAAPAPARPAPQQPARQYQAPAKPAYQKPATNSGNTGGGYQLQPGEVWIDKNNMDQDGSITLGGDEDGNVW